MEQLEMKIFNPSEDKFLQAIEWNFEDLKKELTERSEMYKTVVYTSDDDIKKIAKADRAKLRKLIDVMDTERKRIKKQCMEPVTAFESQVNILKGIVDEAVKNIDSQIKDYEEKKRAEKLDKVKEIYNEEIPEEFRDFLTFKVVLIDKYLLSGTSLKSIREEMQALSDKARKDIEVIKALPEYSFEALERYKNTLDLQSAMRTVNDLRDTAVRKARYEEEQRRLHEEYERKKAAEDEMIANANKGFTATESVNESASKAPAEPVREETCPEERIMTLTFRVTARQSQFAQVNKILMELKNACMNFEMIKE